MTIQIKKKTASVSGHRRPYLRLVQNAAFDTSHLNDISDLVGLSHPKEVAPAPSETDASEISELHQQAIQDIQLLRAGLMNRTELRKRYFKTYKNWDDMKQRCRGNPEAGKVPIPLDPRFEDFVDFLEIVGPRPHDTWSLDRIDPTGPYSPENVRWASKTTQSRNRTNTVYLTYKKQTKPLVEWAEELGVSPGTLRARHRNGWTNEEILEGRRRSVSTTFTPPTSSRNPFDHTPWPLRLREFLERQYQLYGGNGEHRLAFMKRHSEKMLARISAEAGDVCWPDEHSPSEKEQQALDLLTKRDAFWKSIYRDACEKLAGKKYMTQLYGRVHLPECVESYLSNFR
jgi:hypothetical protein